MSFSSLAWSNSVSQFPCSVLVDGIGVEILSTTGWNGSYKLPVCIFPFFVYPYHY